MMDPFAIIVCALWALWLVKNFIKDNKNDKERPTKCF
jgi:hypothetical protein